jgi:hypothetical protein
LPRMKVWAAVLKRLEYQWDGFRPNPGLTHWEWLDSLGPLGTAKSFPYG